MVRRCLAVLVASASLAFASAGYAQQYPEAPIHLVVPYAPGGTQDIAARLLSVPLSEIVKQPVVVENKPGGGGMVAGDYVARSAPDGYTLLVGSNGPLIVRPLTAEKPLYQTQDAFEPVSLLFTIPTLMLVRSDSEFQNLGDLIEFAKANPEKLTLSTGGAGSQAHLLSEYLQSVNNVKWRQVHYKGNAPGVTDLLAGNVDVAFDQALGAIPHIERGSLRALVAFSDKRSSMLPDVQSIEEAGYPEAAEGTYSMVLAPKGTSPEVIATLNKAINEAFARPDIAERVKALGAEVDTGPSDGLRDFLDSRMKFLKHIIEVSKIKVE